ncbi:MAG: colicin V family bacteriocin [Hafnia alvei]|uniref:colicin V family bacteriocin n=1 Tax=Hafnia alvei TaxID=569 RepID=UPI0029107121|nr:colicin V family bacteriocin [Hafnia alvei]MDU7484111.1 colicin V family bacteriocin [Hafnia alvei]
MKNNHKVVLKEITDELELLMVSGGKGNGDWATGAQAVWGATVAGVASSMGYSCSYPAPVYGSSNPTPAGSGLCTGGKPWKANGGDSDAYNYAKGRPCFFDPHNDNDVCY